MEPVTLRYMQINTAKAMQTL